MKKVIWKHIMVPGYQKLRLPKDAQILTFQIQEDKVCIWEMHNEGEKSEEERIFRIIGTGHNFDDEGLKYIGTAQQFSGKLVWHLFEEIQPKYDILH